MADRDGAGADSPNFDDTPARTLSGSVNQEYTCAICLELVYRPVVTANNHKYCMGCITNWLSHSMTDPMTRREWTAKVVVDDKFEAVMWQKFKKEYEEIAKSEPERKRIREEQIKKKKEEEAALDRNVREVKRNFQEGAQMDRASIIVMLEMFGGNVRETIAFLTASEAEVNSLVTLRDVDSGAARVPRDFVASADKLAKVPQEAPKPNSAAHIVQVLLSTDTTYTEHLELQRKNPETVRAVIRVFIEKSVIGSMSPGAKARCLAVAWSRKDTALVDLLLRTGILSPNTSAADVFGIPEVLRACKMLDSNRQIRQKKKQLAKLEAQNARAAKLRRLKNDIKSLEAEATPDASLSGSLIKQIKGNIRKIPAAKLDFFALQMPTGPWKELCDLLHLNPAEGTAVPWFLKHVYGEEPPEGTVLQARDALLRAEGEPAAVLSRVSLPYSVVRTSLPWLSQSCKTVLCKQMPLDQLIWWYEELKGDSTCELDKEIVGRLEAGEKPEVGYGMLMERLMSFRSKAVSAEGSVVFEKLLPFAEDRLRSTTLNLEAPVVVLGDASFSMDVAIRTSTILASLLAAIGGGELTFFSEQAKAPPEGTPASAEDCIKVAFSTNTEGLTAPAAGIRKYLNEKKVAKCIVVVSDEGENAKHDGEYFHEVFHKYYHTVYPAKLVFVSFLEVNAKGQMAVECEKIGFNPTCFSFDKDKPDLTKLDALLGTLAVASGMEEVTLRQEDMVQPAQLVGGEAAAAPAPAPGELIAQRVPRFIDTDFASRVDYTAWVAAGCPPRTAAAAAEEKKK